MLRGFILRGRTEPSGRRGAGGARAGVLGVLEDSRAGQGGQVPRADHLAERAGPAGGAGSPPPPRPVPCALMFLSKGHQPPLTSAPHAIPASNSSSPAASLNPWGAPAPPTGPCLPGLPCRAEWGLLGEARPGQLTYWCTSAHLSAKTAVGAVSTRPGPAPARSPGESAGPQNPDSGFPPTPPPSSCSCRQRGAGPTALRAGCRPPGPRPGAAVRRCPRAHHACVPSGTAPPGWGPLCPLWGAGP